MRKYFNIDDLFEYLNKQENKILKDLNTSNSKVDKASLEDKVDKAYLEGKLDIIEDIKSCFNLY